MLTHRKTEAANPMVRVLRGERQARPPIWLMRQAGRYLPEYREVRARAGTFLDLCYTPELAAEVTLQPVERFDLDAAILFCDILVVPHALGRRVEFVEGEGPCLEPLRTGTDIADIDPTAVVEALAPVYETVERVRGSLAPDRALIGFAGAPWTVATYMLEGGSSRDFAIAKSWIENRAPDFAALIEVLVDATVRHLDAQVVAGAELVQIFDSWAGALESEEFARWSVGPTRAIVSKLKDRHPDLPVIGFPRGADADETGYLHYAEHTAVDAVGIDTAVPTSWAARALQPLCAVQGNLDPDLLRRGGEPMARAARRILRDLREGPHIFNLGHGIMPETPPAHVTRLIEVVRSWAGDG